MKKIALILMLAFTVTGCRFSLEPSICDGCVPPTYVQDKNTTNETTAVIYYYEESCYDEPYYYAAEWCEWYDDGTKSIAKVQSITVGIITEVFSLLS